MEVSITAKLEDPANEQLRVGEMTQEQKAKAYDALIEAMDDPRLGVSIECYPNWIVRRDGEFAVFKLTNGLIKKIAATHDLISALHAVRLG